MKFRFLLLSLCVVLAFSVMAVLGESQVQLRYRPDAQSAWLTQGRLAVTTELTSPEGTQTRTEEQVDLAWVDRVVSRDALGTVTQERQVKTWTEAGGTENLAPTETLHFSVSKVAEQKLATLTGASTAMDQPALYPVRSVAVGEEWPVEQTTHTTIPVGARTIPVLTRIHGTGKLLRLEEGVGVVEFALQIDSAGPVLADGTAVDMPWAETRSSSQVHWTMNVDLATGVALAQKTESRTEQTVTINVPEKSVFPSRTETVLELTTARSPD